MPPLSYSYYAPNGCVPLVGWADCAPSIDTGKREREGDASPKQTDLFFSFLLPFLSRFFLLGIDPGN